MLLARLFPILVIAAGGVSSGHAVPITITKPPPTVTLLDAGKEPRRDLRLKFVQGASQRSVMSMKISQKETTDGEEAPAQAVPPIIETLEVQVESVGLDGDATISMQIVDAHADAGAEGVDPVVAAMMNDAFANIVGLAATFTVTTRGVYTSMTFDPPNDLPQEMDQALNSMSKSMDQMSNPFPIKPVGVGAKWRVVSVIEMGASLVMTREFELVAIDGDTLTLRATGDIHLAHGKDQANIPDLPEGMTMTFDSISGSVNGTTVQNLRELMPRSGKVSQSTTIVSTMSFDEVVLKSKMQIDLVVELTTPAPIGNEPE